MAVGGHVVAAYIGMDRVSHRPLEQHLRFAHDQLRIELDRYRQNRVSIAVIKLPTVRRPEGLRPPIGRDLPAFSWAGEGGGIHLVAPGDVGGIGEPAAVGGEGRLNFTEGGGQKRFGGPITVELQRPEVGLVLGRLLPERQDATIRRPVTDVLVPLPLEQGFGRSAPVGRHPVDVEGRRI